jgi:hypothetical protein
MNDVVTASGGLVTDFEALAAIRFEQSPTSAGGLGLCRTSGGTGYGGCFDSDGSPNSANAIKYTNGVVDGIVGGAAPVM